ncbi:DUF4844 domain-containing protein [Acinetobacter gerneri]|uniref:DUF4844 domain-containing protein n=1 Tax=Acinetobacter gerneri TaxID=202952 RepID=UPI0028A98364|nr:DUF4844 domain-containing protein [Acinetobacter gerneri]
MPYKQKIFKLILIVFLQTTAFTTVFAKPSPNVDYLELNIDVIKRLMIFSEQEHFAEFASGNKTRHYILNESIRLASLNFVLLYKEKKPTQADLLNTLQETINKIPRDRFDTDEAEQIATNFENIMDIVGLDSSNGILNTWMYGEEISNMIEKQRHNMQSK